MNNTNPLYYLEELKISKGPIGSKYRNFVAKMSKGVTSPKVRNFGIGYTIATAPFPFTATIPVGAFTMLPANVKKRLVYGILTGNMTQIKKVAKIMGVKTSELVRAIKEQGLSKKTLMSIL